MTRLIPVGTVWLPKPTAAAACNSRRPEESVNHSQQGSKMIPVLTGKGQTMAAELSVMRVRCLWLKFMLTDQQMSWYDRVMHQQEISAAE
jgi:hypothetical protein